MNVSVCVCVCLSASIYPELHIRSFSYIFCMLPMAVARSSSGSVLIRRVRPVLRMTSHLYMIGYTVAAGDVTASSCAGENAAAASYWLRSVLVVGVGAASIVQGVPIRRGRSLQCTVALLMLIAQLFLLLPVVVFTMVV